MRFASGLKAKQTEEEENEETTEVESSDTSTDSDTSSKKSSSDSDGGIPFGGFLRNFAAGVARGAMASDHPTGKMFGAAMAGAMPGVFQGQEIDLERRRAAADEADFAAMKELDFETTEPAIDESLKRTMSMIQQQTATPSPGAVSGGEVKSFRIGDMNANPGL